MNIELKQESWENIIECIHNSKINSEGNFWASVQAIEGQIETQNEQEELTKVKIGNVEVELNGKPFVISVDTFSHEDGFDDYFDTNEKAIEYAKLTGESMLKKHAYDKKGNWIGDGGTF